MSERRTTIAVGILIVGLLVASVALPSIAAGKPANQVSVAHLPGEDGALANPTGAAWSDVETTQVPLTSAPSGLPNAQSTATKAVDVKAARTDSELFVRLQWTDDTKNTSTDSPQAFADAVAMQVPADTTTHPAIALGSPDTPVNVWYWNAANGAQDIVAGGQGSITQMDDDIATQAVYEDGTWTVVLHRSLSSDVENHASFTLDNDVDVAFAVWNGANAERSGHHAVSAWFTYPFGPANTGPSYQYLLWAIAGIALAAALIITVRAIRDGSRP